MSSKRAFVNAAKMRGANFAELCREHGVSRPTGYKWLKRFRLHGYRGLEELSRRPRSSPGATGEEVISAVLSLRDKHSSWGPKKLASVVRQALGEDGPSAATVARVIKSAGQIRVRRPMVRVWHVDGKPRIDVQSPNDLWTIDFKGWWRARNGERCEPFTVRDACSRKVLETFVVKRTTGKIVRRRLEHLFAIHGVPSDMLMDNGSPWINVRARGGLTKLTVWLLSLGIRLHRSRVAAPQDNGGHERMHRDLDELRLTPARSRRAQQALCDEWTLDFNHVRPHDALEGKTPAEVYGVPKPNLPAVQLPVYPAGFVTRRVHRNGMLMMGGDRVPLGKALIGQLIGLQYESGLRWRAWFFNCDLGSIEFADNDLIRSQKSLPSGKQRGTRKHHV